MGWLVILGSIPIGVLGFVFDDQIETVARNLYLVSFTLIVFGIILGIADRTGSKTSPSTTHLARRHHLRARQAMALIPGVSRSGATISGGLFLGYTREAATRYAFLLAIPSVMGAGLYQMKDIAADGAVPGVRRSWPRSSPSGSASRSSRGCCATSRPHSYMPFVIYRIVLGTASSSCSGPGCSPPDRAPA